jgi:hypothetical protein
MKAIYRYLAPAAPLALVLALAASPASADYQITQWTIAGGGSTEASGGGWQLAGTIGQWEATEARALSGGGWRLTGGFWGFSLQELADLIFSDRFAEISGLNALPPESPEPQED